MTPPLLDIADLSVEYRLRSGRIQAVRDLSIAVKRGESFGLVGESGCGKSSVAMAIMRFLGPFGRIVGGRIVLEGRDLVALSSADLRAVRGSRVAMVYQEATSALNPTLTIGRQLHEVLYKEDVLLKDRQARIAKVLADVRIADAKDVLGRYPHQLSGGQQQRIVIAMALLANPSLLILDEPTTALDVTVQAAFTDLLLDLRQKYGTSMIYISHNLAVVARVCDRVGVMYLGELVETGSVDAVFQHPRHPYTRGLIACIPRTDRASPGRPLTMIPGQAILPPGFAKGCRFGDRCAHHLPHTCDGAEIPLTIADRPDHLVRCCRWQEIGPAVADPPRVERQLSTASPMPILKVQEISKQYRSGGAPAMLARLTGREIPAVRANERISFDLAAGESVAIVGESGCGKSTLARILMGLIAPTSGRIEFADVDLATLPVERRDARLIAMLQMVFQNPDTTLNPAHSIRHAVARAVLKLGGLRSRPAIHRAVNALLRLAQLPEAVADRLPEQLSGGQKQRVALARAFAGDPRILVADEPVSALDVSVQAAVVNVLMTMKSERGTALIFISHDLALVRSIADRVLVMYLGLIVEAGAVREIFDPPYHPYTEALLSATPVLDQQTVRRTIPAPTELTSAINPPPGCPYAPRCHRHLGQLCDRIMPPAQMASDGHLIRCHIPLSDLRRVESAFA
jgi:peptide/nickel transport system ATP-binding protein